MRLCWLRLISGIGETIHGMKDIAHNRHFRLRGQSTTLISTINKPLRMRTTWQCLTHTWVWAYVGVGTWKIVLGSRWLDFLEPVASAARLRFYAVARGFRSRCTIFTTQVKCRRRAAEPNQHAAEQLRRSSYTRNQHASLECRDKGCGINSNILKPPWCWPRSVFWVETVEAWRVRSS